RESHTPFAAPAVSPPLAARRSMSRPVSRPPSRPQSRSSQRDPAADSSTAPPEALFSPPLADVEEHEPLFPDSDDEEKKGQVALREGVEKAFARPASTASKSKRFPGNDVWEDAPPSSLLQATVVSPPPGRVDGADGNTAEEQH